MAIAQHTATDFRRQCQDKPDTCRNAHEGVESCVHPRENNCLGEARHLEVHCVPLGLRKLDDDGAVRVDSSTEAHVGALHEGLTILQCRILVPVQMLTADVAPGGTALQKHIS